MPVNETLINEELINEELINEALILYLEDLSFITLSTEERQRISADLKNIIAGMQLLSALDTSALDASGVRAQTLSPGFCSGLRKDNVAVSFPCGEILKNAPQSNGETFIVPKAVD